MQTLLIILLVLILLSGVPYGYTHYGPPGLLPLVIVVLLVVYLVRGKLD